ncbi:cytochrome P450 9e2-like protein [Dinothrombium tinctorium]|uniref:Cytochrome P450 9e2-like protein n=1 Tax=Dinothrombium tinctorium TaxID=1965070 RepID=A0A3S3S1N0_9ACAR|nr:cytochrome P450 9e2-like protein [Dinothrombium tinctorium]
MSRLERECQAEYKLGEITIPAGMKIYVPIYALHRDEAYFEQPDEFEPERFLTNGVLNSENDYFSKASSEQKRIPFYPFGDGPRFCVGMQISLFIMKLCLFKLYKYLHFNSPIKTKVKCSQYTLQMLIIMPFKVEASKYFFAY